MKENKFLWIVAFLTVSFFTLGDTAFGASELSEITDNIWKKPGVSLRTQESDVIDGPWIFNTASYWTINRNSATNKPYIRCAEKHGDICQYSCDAVLSSSITTIGVIENKTRAHARECYGWKQRVQYLAQDDTSIAQWLQPNRRITPKTIVASILIGSIIYYLGTKNATQVACPICPEIVHPVCPEIVRSVPSICPPSEVCSGPGGLSRFVGWSCAGLAGFAACAAGVAMNYVRPYDGEVGLYWGMAGCVALISMYALYG